MPLWPVALLLGPSWLGPSVITLGAETPFSLLACGGCWGPLCRRLAMESACWSQDVSSTAFVLVSLLLRCLYILWRYPKKRNGAQLLSFSNGPSSGVFSSCTLLATVSEDSHRRVSASAAHPDMSSTPTPDAISLPLADLSHSAFCCPKGGGYAKFYQAAHSSPEMPPLELLGASNSFHVPFSCVASLFCRGLHAG